MKYLVGIGAALGLLAAQPSAAEMVRTNGVELEYQVSGSGEPLLLLHGFGSCIDDSWGALIPELAKSHRVIAVNMRGHGRSTPLTSRFTHGQSAEDIKGLLDALGVQKVRAIGYSSGGMTLLHLATRYPDRLEKMVIVGATSHFGEQARTIMRAVADRGLPPFVQDQFERCSPQGTEQAKELARQFGAFKDSHDDMAFTPADLATIKADTMIVHGDRDDFFPVDIPAAMYKAIPKARLWIVPDGGHEPTGGASNEHFLQTVELFLKQ